MVLPYLIVATSPTIAETFSNTGRRFSQWSQCAFYFYPLSSGNRTKRSADGYAGGLSAKQYLLELEQRNKNIFSLFPSVHKVSE